MRFRFDPPTLPGALCAQPGRDPELWYALHGPRRQNREGRARAEQAKAICRACPECAACLAWALEHAERVGVWGGTTPEERAAMRGGAA